MMIYTYLQRMDPDRLARVLGDSQLAQELPELPLTTAAKREICPAELSRRLFGDDRGCEDIFFIRHTRRPERSWFTLNVDVNTKKILQNHGYGNEWAQGKRLHIPRAVEEFVDLWEKKVLRPWTLPPEKGAEQKAKTKKTRAKEAPAA